MRKLLKKTKALAAAVALTSGVLALSISSSNIHNKYLRYEVGSSTVKVLGPRGGGSGFAVKGDSGKDYIMTNKHVCELATGGWLSVKSDSGLTLWKRVVYKDNIHDLCLIEGDSRFDSLSIGSTPSPGDYFYIVGHPALRALTVSQGEYIGFANVTIVDDSVKERSQCRGTVYELTPLEQMEFGIEWACIRSLRSYSTTAVAYGGNSGSPVVNQYGNLIGVLFAGSTEQERDNYVVPLHEVKRVLSKF